MSENPFQWKVYLLLQINFRKSFHWYLLSQLTNNNYCNVNIGSIGSPRYLNLNKNNNVVYFLRFEPRRALYTLTLVDAYYVSQRLPLPYDHSSLPLIIFNGQSSRVRRSDHSVHQIGLLFDNNRWFACDNNNMQVGNRIRDTDNFR